VSSDMVVWAVGALTAGLGIRAVARVCEVDPNTVRQWLVAAADHLNAFSPDFLHDVRVTQGQLDALCALLSAGKAGKGSAAEAIERLARAPPGIWVALDPVTTLRLALDVGAICGPSGRPDRGARRHAAVPHRWRQGVDHRTADPLRPVGPAPTPPGQRPHAEAPVETAAAAALCARGEDRAAAPAGAGESARGLWPPRGRQAGRSGLRLAEPDSLSRAGPPGNASAGGRRGAACATLCKGEDGLRQPLALSHGYDNFCLPHASLRQPLPQSLPTNGTGSAKPWRPWTPAMAAGLTDRVWTLREVLLLRVPPWPQPVGG